jgi:hypothetical protein
MGVPPQRAGLRWPRAAARLARQRRPRLALPIDFVPPLWRRRLAVVPRQAPQARRVDGLRLSWLLVIGGFAALASLLLFWVGMTVVRSVTEPIEAQIARDIVVAQPAPVVAQPAPVARPPMTSPATPLLPRVGQAVGSAGIQLTVSSVVKRSTHGGSLVAPGKTFVVVGVVLESGRRAATSYGPAGFRLRAADGDEQAALIPSADDRQSLKGGGVLINGEITRGTVAFEVPVGADGFVLAFQPDEVVPDYQTLRVALGD